MILQKSYEDFRILKVISMKMGSSNNIHPTSVESLDFKQSTLNENFLC